MKRGSIDWSLSDANRRPATHDTRSRIVWHPTYSKFHSASITPILLQWEWCHLPILQTSADVASPCFDLIIYNRQRPGCSPYASAVTKAIAKKLQSAARGTVGSRGDQVWLRYLVRGGRLFCRGQSTSPGGNAFEGGPVHGVTYQSYRRKNETKLLCVASGQSSGHRGSALFEA